MQPKIPKLLHKPRHMPAQQGRRWVLEVFSSLRRKASAARDVQDMVVEAAPVETEPEERRLRAVLEVQEEEGIFTLATREIHQTMVVSPGPKTFSAVSKLTESATLWARMAAIKRVERTDASHGRECK